MQDKEHFRFVQTKLLDKIEVYAQVLANDLQNIFANVGDATSKVRHVALSMHPDD